MTINTAIVYRIAFTIFIIFWHSISILGNENHWNQIAEGLEFGEFKVNKESPAGDSTIIVLRIDPTLYDINLFSISEIEGEDKFTVKEWCEKYNLVAGINAGMFATDFSTHVGYMKSYEYINNPEIIQKDYRSAAAFNPKDDNMPKYHLFDLDEENMDTIINRYNSIIQNIRLIKNPGENRWEQKPNKWSEAALGKDIYGNILFIFCRSSYTMHDFNNLLLELPIDIVSAQHLEGGPEAQLYIKNNNLEFIGSYETNFFENDNNDRAWPIPNIIGISKKDIR